MEPDNPVAAHLLAACSGENVPARTSDACVEKMFDDFAGSFDAKLTKLRYRAPELTATVLSEVLPAPDKSLDIADAGCGTGLCGPLLAPFARRLVGVDLSARMLEGARLRGVYDELLKEELTAFLNRHPASFDVVVSADTLVYFGDLMPVVQALAGALRPGGIAAFTLEEAAFDQAAAAEMVGFVLNTHGRYGHFEARIREQLEGMQLEPTIVRAELRLEGGKPVAGLVVRARKAAGFAGSNMNQR
jgi:predicted TPR repeat methyltransferase